MRPKRSARGWVRVVRRAGGEKKGSSMVGRPGGRWEGSEIYVEMRAMVGEVGVEESASRRAGLVAVSLVSHKG